nr:MAG TPA: hypothetical protein [Caudoviricetes sp.]
MIPDEETPGFETQKLIFKFLPTEECDKCHGMGTLPSKKRYRVSVVTGRASFPVARSEPMTKQEAQLFLQDLEAKINTSRVRAVTVGDTLVMVEEIGRIIIEEEGEKK